MTDNATDWPPEAGPTRIGALIPSARVEVWDDAAHGLYHTHAERVNNLVIKTWYEACSKPVA